MSVRSDGEWWYWCPWGCDWLLGEGLPVEDAGVDQLFEHEAEAHD